MEEVVAAARAVRWDVLGERRLCNPCLGRLFGKLGHGFTNEERGRAVRAAFGLPGGSCWLCSGLTTEFDHFARLVRLKLEPWEHTTFLVGSKIDPEVVSREESLWAELATTAPEPLKAEVNREVGKRVEASTGKRPDRDEPNVVAILDTAFDHVDVQANPLYLRGRYRKLARGIPQTRWPCRRCRGKGCERCAGTGKMYATSVEEVLAAAVMDQSGGTGHALHGMGREDVDARMLGTGRPFILEIREPRRRRIDAAEAARRVNASGSVEVDAFVPARGSDIVALKDDRAAKTYRVVVRLVTPVEQGKLKEGMAALVAQSIAQRTPSRVAHRRADTIRHRRVLAADVVGTDGDLAEVRVTADAGTYVKELMHGDQGRTRPSLSERLGVVCEVLELDVLAVHDGG